MSIAGFWPPSVGKFVPAHWSEQDQGLYFNGHSMAYTERFFAAQGENDAITIELTIAPVFQKQPRFGVILNIYDLESDHQIVIGQWNQNLVVLDNDDFSNRERLPKIYAALDQNQQINRIKLYSDANGTRVYVNNRLQGSSRKLKLALPAHPDSSHLTLGNDVSASQPWKGAIQAVTVYDHSGRSQSGLPPSLQYRFSPTQGNIITDLSTQQIHLILPAKAIILKKKILQLPRRHDLNTAWLWQDSLINFLGFIPFGFLLAGLLSKKSTNQGASLVWIVGSTGFLFSLGIEMTQIFIPERTSYLLDLILNSAGGFSGAIIFLTHHRIRRAHQQSSR